MSEVAVVGKRYALVIPKPIRKKLNIQEGQRVLVRVEGDGLVVEPLPKDSSAVLEELIPEQYEESKHEAKSEELLKKLASGRH
jgi:AbrB family looped-hinge helix DNA binding protein